MVMLKEVSRRGVKGSESKVRGSAETHRTATEFRSSSYTNDFDN